ncbi:ABC transporter substrate-binding protein [Flavobacterium alkalisoli]|uniref:ABC transporter substrate-binding protein n=1 Tax=Flavobacterium alkalisoli TaxID=2602769 RepID=UPI003A94A9C3
MDNEVKIGILIPQSKQYKTLDREFLNGFKLNNLNVKYYIESIGIGSDTQIIIEKIQKLNFQEDISIIIGFFGHHNVESVYEYASDNNITLIASDLGAVVPFNIQKQKGIFINSFSLVESCYLLGNHFEEKKLDRIACSTSYYDSGYGLLLALNLSFSNNKNIGFTGHYITPFMPRENEAEIMNESITTLNPNVVFSFNSGLYAEENTDFLIKNDLTSNYTFYTTPFTVTPKLAKHIADTNNELYITSSWMNDDSCSFSKLYKKTHKEQPSIFSMLGYENGLIVKAILENNANDAETINSLKTEGPRGTVFINPETNRTIYDSHIYEIYKKDSGEAGYRKKELLKNDGNFIKSIIKTEKPEKIGGWQNAYLCH